MPHLPVPIAAIAVSRTVAADDFSGTFTGKGEDGTVTLTLRADAEGRVTGQLSEGDTPLALSGRLGADGRKVTGTLTVAGASIPFEVRLTAVGVDFVLIVAGEEDVVSLTRSGATPSRGPKPSLPGPAPAATPSPAPRATPAAPKTKGPEPSKNAVAFRHPAGVTLALPPGWAIRTDGALTSLLPPGATRPDGDELYFFLVGEANGVRAADDPRLAAFVERLLVGDGDKERGLLNGAVALRRVKAEGGAAWEGAAPTGQTLHVRAFFAPADGRVAAVVALGLAARIQPREGALRAAVQGVRAIAPGRDPRLVGDWSARTATRARDARDAVGRLQASSVTDSQTGYRIGADGRFVESRTSRTIAIGQGVSIDSGDQVERTSGLWAAADGRIAFCLDDGVYVLGTYRVGGDGIVVELPDRVITLHR